ncbi:hypothetical protein GGD66_006565 [Bradyrhizobium sp. CIR48]|uniref:hypothetical protein n=1 Tax=Bradyrhizobium sp. CIR48 TaxID=2663840 RepID=UPI001605B085|nr:hypothetical protein [Bradyrhizobium sp. CIR48]MBB4427979.1 hypothetical protein [Bradyrhizobium sp. CIR48]
MLRQLDGTERDSLEFKGFRQHQAQHAFQQRETVMLLKLLAIPAGLMDFNCLKGLMPRLGNFPTVVSHREIH